MVPNSLPMALFFSYFLMYPLEPVDTSCKLQGRTLTEDCSTTSLLLPTMSKKSLNTLKPHCGCIVSYLGTVCSPLHVYFMEKLNKIQISESRQPDGEISHLKCGNLLLHIVRGEGV